ncbi:MAG: ACP S-malonyltransferase [Chloroflexi bacterium]|nr:ACP S-malonyltransferase [Chloroflexota bacterium]
MPLDPRTTAFVFPGQGSQAVGMGRELALASAAARQTFLEADELLGFKLSALCWEGPESALNDTVNTQPALLAHSVAALRALHEALGELRPAYVAGHSLGELSALTATGALSFPDALRLVRERGRLMKAAGEAAPGGMAAILNLGTALVAELCAQASAATGKSVQVANDNCPGQVVISGDDAALEAAMALARERGARRALRLAVSIAAHSQLMAPAQQGFSAAVAATTFRAPAIPVVGNVSAAPLTSPQEIRAELAAQLTSPVRWSESVQTMLGHGVTTFVELGSKDVLTGLLKRIDRAAAGLAVGAPQDLAALG